jgi:RNA-directed DNA polymerase
MRGIRTFLEEVLRLRVNEQKSAVARPGKRKFLGYTCTVQRETRLRIAPESVRRLKQKVRKRLRAGCGRSLKRTIEDLNPLLRGWVTYFQLAQNKGLLEDLDGWNQAIPVAYFTRMGLVSLLREQQRLQCVR